MSKSKKKSQTTIMILLIIMCVLLYYFIFVRTSSKLADEINDFEYTLSKNDSSYMKNTYEELKQILNQDDINYEEYAKCLAKLFVIDLYTIDTKTNMYDVGSLEYILPENRDSFKAKVQDTLYNHLSNKKNRKIDYPEVTSVIIDSFNQDDNVYSINASWTYKKNLGYDTKGSFVIVRVDNKLYVSSFEGGE